MQIRDTIVAISTPPGRSGIGMIRLSGADAREIASRILRFPAGHEWKPWTAALAELVDDRGNVVDQVVATCRFMEEAPHFERRFIDYALDNLRVKKHPPA